MIKRILVPLDGSDLAKAVLPYVEDLSRRLQAEVYFVEVVGIEPNVTGTRLSATILVKPESLAEELEVEAKTPEGYLSALAAEWQAQGLETKWDVVRDVVGGAPGISITEFAHSHGADLIALATHGRSGLGRVVFGSVAEQVLRESGLPVLLVKSTRHTRT